MALNFLFIYPDFWEIQKRVHSVGGSYQEGIASISAVLKEDGHNVSLYQITYMPAKEEFLSKIAGYNPDMIGVTIRSVSLESVIEMTGWLDDKFPDIPIIAGGYHPTLAPDETISFRGIDAICIGEGEYPLRDMIRAYEKNGNRFDTQCESFWFKNEDGSIEKNPVRPFLRDLNELPFPDIDLFDIPNLKSNKDGQIADAIVSRGCLYACAYCSNAHLRKAYKDAKNYARYRSPENAIIYLERILEKDPNIHYFAFGDAILNMFDDWFYEFIDLYKTRIGLKYSCNLRFDLMDEKMCRVLAETGCYYVTIGLESGNEEFRRKYLKRNISDEQILKVTKWLKSEGITVITYNIVGFPHETLALSLETVKLNARANADKIIINIFQPYPSTELRKISEDAGFIDANSRLDPTAVVPLRMPNFPKRDILYLFYAFGSLVKMYRKVYSITDAEKRARKEAALDKRITGAFYPRGLLRRIYQMRRWFITHAKQAVANTAPSFYRKLRERKYKILNQ